VGTRVRSLLSYPLDVFCPCFSCSCWFRFTYDHGGSCSVVSCPWWFMFLFFHVHAGSFPCIRFHGGSCLSFHVSSSWRFRSMFFHHHGGSGQVFNFHGGSCVVHVWFMCMCMSFHVHGGSCPWYFMVMVVHV